MTPFITSLCFGAGVAAWVWAKVGRRTGNADPKTGYIVALLAGGAALIFFYTLLRFVLNIH